MGNSTSSGRGPHDETVDFGALVPQGVYTGARDWNQQIVGQLIADRRLAPFYRPLEDYEDAWDDAAILAHRRAPPPPPADEDGGEAHVPPPAPAPSRIHHKRGSTAGKEKEGARLNEAALYRGAVECPICFLYYPPNINYSRCCDQAICTECFVQIKRAEPDAQHLESEPAACPYCVRSDFGVVYRPPSWRAGIGSEGGVPPSPGGTMQTPRPAMRKRRPSVSANDASVVTTDQIRPDWEVKLAAVKAAVARRANRRIIMRQVGDRLIPVGISSGRVQVLPAEGDTPDATGEGSSNGSRRQRRRERELSRILGLAGVSSTNYPNGTIGAEDLEELMLAEAMRLSLVDEEERKRKEDKEKAAKAGKQPESAGASSPGVALPGAGPSSAASPGAASPVTAPGSASPGSAGASRTTLALPAITGASLLPPPADERGRAGHRPSSSISSIPSGGGGTPTVSPTSAARARSQPPASVLGAALVGTGAGAAAVGSPGAHSPVADPLGAVPAPAAASPIGVHTPVSPAAVAAPILAVSPPAEPETPAAGSSPAVPEPEPVHVAPPTPSAELQPAPTAAPTAALGIPTASVGIPAPRPAAAHMESFASSIASVESEGPTAYDMLSSSPESDDGFAHRPLLGTETPIGRTPAVERDAPFDAEM